MLPEPPLGKSISAIFCDEANAAFECAICRFLPAPTPLTSVRMTAL
jgi:hypothetical protein